VTRTGCTPAADCWLQPVLAAVRPSSVTVLRAGLGHSNISVTLGIYTHMDEDSRRDALDRLAQALRLPARATVPGPADGIVAVTQPGPRSRKDLG